MTRRLTPAFIDAGGTLGVAKGALEARFGHGLGGLFDIGWFVAASGKDKPGMFVRAPMAAH
jgi:hypothetical protein